MTVILLLGKYWREVAIVGLLAAVLALTLTWNHHERQVGATAVLGADTKATAKVESEADAQTEANVVKAAMAEQGARSAQNAVDAYMVAHPVGDIRLPDPPGDRGAGVRQARAAGGRASNPGAEPAPVPAVPPRSKGPDLGPAVTEIVQSASRVAVELREGQQRESNTEPLK